MEEFHEAEKICHLTIKINSNCNSTCESKRIKEQTETQDVALEFIWITPLFLLTP